MRGPSVAGDEEHRRAPKLDYCSMKPSVKCDRVRAAHLMRFLPAHFTVEEERVAGRKRCPAVVETRLQNVGRRHPRHATSLR